MNSALDESIDKKLDRLYELLPVVYRLRDADRRYPLKALLRIIAEQVNVVEDDINQLYKNWFIETCEDWVVPYIGELVGYKQVHEAGEPLDISTPEGQKLGKILIARRDVANTIRHRRRKGTLALLDELAFDVAGWPARAVEFYKLLAWSQHVNHRRLHRGGTLNLRDVDALDLMNGPFDSTAHTVDVRRINSSRSKGKYNIPSVGLFVWRLKAYSVTKTRAHCLDKQPQCYTFSILGNEAPLFTRVPDELSSPDVPEELKYPSMIRRRGLERFIDDYYGEGKSIAIWIDSLEKPVPADIIKAADLSRWHYKAKKGQILVDPVLGRIVFPQDHLPRKQVWVSYYYGFSADIGGGEYRRSVAQPDDATIIRAKGKKALEEALIPWQEDQQPHEQPKNVVIEITDSDVYTLPVNLFLQENHYLQLRAAIGCRPVIRILDWKTDLEDSLSVKGELGSRFVMDGLLVVGRPVLMKGSRVSQTPMDNHANTYGDLCDVVIRHCTLVPGWSIECDCDPCHGDEPSLILENTSAKIRIEHSILGSIEITSDEEQSDPVPICISDSIIDSTSPKIPALSSSEGGYAYTMLKIVRSTVLGKVLAHQITLAENSIFRDRVCVARRQTGCVRFCYILPSSRTPRRYQCQPDVVAQIVKDDNTIVDKAGAILREQNRVRPQFNSVRYGNPAYCQLADACAVEITRGADDESEMGVFHDLFQPQREANLRARLDEYTPAGSDAGIIFAS